MPTTNSTPHTIDSLLRAVEERDSQLAFLNLMLDKLTLQLLRARRSQCLRFSEQLDDPLEEGIFTGISGGASRAVPTRVAQRAPEGSVICCMLPDTG